MKQYRILYNIGKSKYVVSYHDGIKKHPDQSEFFDIEVFKNKKKMNKFLRELRSDGYIEKCIWQ